MRNKAEEIRHQVQMSFCYEMPQHMSLVLTKLNIQESRQRLILADGPDRRVCVLDQETLKMVNEIPDLANEQIRCAITTTCKTGLTTEQHIFIGCTNGLLLRLDPVNFFITMKVKLKKHIFCLLQIDEETVLCGQLYGYLDLVRISDGEIVLSEQLKHKTGNIISMIKTKARLHEVTLATQKGIFFANVRRGGQGLRETDVAQLDNSMPYGRAAPDEQTMNTHQSV